MGCLSSKDTKDMRDVRGATLERKTTEERNAIVERRAQATPSVSLTTKYAVQIQICQAKNIPKMDLWAHADPYIRVQLDDDSDTERSTVTRWNTSHPVWNAAIDFPPSEDQPKILHLECWDFDRLTRDDFVGLVNIDLERYWGQENPQFEWFPIRHRTKDKQMGSVQVMVTARAVTGQHVNAVMPPSFSHVLEVHVNSATQLKRQDAIGKNEVYVTAEFGNKTAVTSQKSGSDVEFDETAFFWASDFMSKYQIKFSVKEADVKQDDEIGFLYVPVGSLFSGEDAELKVKDELVFETDTDKELGAVGRRSSRDLLGFLSVTVKLHRKEDLISSRLDQTLSLFDTNNDGSLSREEVAAMFEAINLDLSDEEFEAIWELSDEDKSGEISQEELETMLGAICFQSSDSASRLLTYLEGGAEAAMMAGVTAKPNKNQDQVRIMDRDSGLIVHENIPHYIKVAIKALYGGAVRRGVATGSKSNSIMLALTQRQGKIYDNPSSVKAIPKFVKLHSLNLDEVEKPLSEYRTFNEFFYRALKPSARPIASPDNPRVAVSPADCRMMCFPDINDATKFWIKGDKFTVESLLGPRADALAHLYKSGSLCIARLAPQDYHRWHFPVGGKYDRETPLIGSLHTVSPFAINSNVNVYTENKRVICELHSPEFGVVTLVAIGATMVGSINFLVKEGDEVKKADQHGYFAFGGSTVLVLFEPGKIQFDADLLANSGNNLETLVRVNTQIGVAVDSQ